MARSVMVCLDSAYRAAVPPRLPCVWGWAARRAHRNDTILTAAGWAGGGGGGDDN